MNNFVLFYQIVVIGHKNHKKTNKVKYLYLKIVNSTILYKMSLLLLFQIGLIQSIKTANDTATIFLSSTESFSIDLDNLIEG